MSPKPKPPPKPTPNERPKPAGAWNCVVCGLVGIELAQCPIDGSAKP